MVIFVVNFVEILRVVAFVVKDPRIRTHITYANFCTKPKFGETDPTLTTMSRGMHPVLAPTWEN